MVEEKKEGGVEGKIAFELIPLSLEAAATLAQTGSVTNLLQLTFKHEDEDADPTISSTLPRPDAADRVSVQ